MEANRSGIGVAKAVALLYALADTPEMRLAILVFEEPRFESDPVVDRLDEVLSCPDEIAITYHCSLLCPGRWFERRQFRRRRIIGHREAQQVTMGG